ncbi:FtsX-like permease family protein [Blastococcus xanthinilyticus]|uniref:FtsX-like permease family protein n=1 Tax=Blastococcus xanthinilyticus TaxID=1564164 RepID=A0A5S5CVP2_9ACTN|nr:FtsX-like permease family protein [Blastococcus xanthinilyticus]TYP87860.1 FtsX-like permease family protein [Blastococcus xanthinilyticus]
MNRPGRRGAAVLVVRLALTAVRRSPLPAVAGALVVALGVVVLLAGLSMHPTAQARGAADKAAMAGEFAADGEPGLLIAHSSGSYRDRPITASLVADTAGGGLVPPGLDRVPAPGEVVLSPAMRELWSDPGTTLAQRYPGRDVGTVTRAGLVGPGALVVWIGVDRDRMPETRVVTGFGGAGVADIADMPSELRLAVPLLVIGFLLPLVALFLTVATMGTAARERRLAALRLLGFSARHARLVAALESALVVVPGVVLGCLVFRLAAPVLAPHLPVRGGVWPDHVFFSLPVAAGLLVVLPLLGTAATWWALRRIDVSPLGVVRGAGDRELRRRRLLPLGAGCLALAGSAAAGHGADDVTLAGALLLAAVVLLLVGIVLAAPLLCRVAAQGLGRVLPGIPAQLAAARVRRDATGAARLVTGSALLVFVSGLLLSFFPLLETGNAAGLRALRDTAGGNLLVADVQLLDTAALAELRADPGVSGVARLTQVQISDGAGQGGPLITATDCAELSGVLPALGGCSAGSLLLAPADSDAKAVPLRTDGPLQAVTMVESADGGSLDTVGLGPLTTSEAPRTSEVLGSLDELTGGTIGLVDVSALPAAARPTAAGGTLLVRPAAGSAELERVRTLLTRATSAASVLTVDEQVAEAERTTQTYRDITLAALGCAALVGVLTLTSTLLQQVREHRRALVALWMAGMPRATVRAATLLQSSLVILPVVALSLVLGLATATTYLALADGGATRLPWAAIGVVAAGAAALPLLATALTLPALRTTTHPQLLPD